MNYNTDIKTMKLCHLSCFLFITILGSSNSEVYTALSDLEEILDTEFYLITTLENYIKAEQQKLDLLKKYAELYQKHHKRASEDVQTYVANPINAYILVKKLTTDWDQVESLMNTDVAEEFFANVTYIKENLKFPTSEDLNGAAVALTRLQDTYQLDTSALARGELNGVKYTTELTAADCFELGRQTYNNADYYHSLLWMREADNRLKRETNETVERSEILEYLAFSTYKQGNLPLALDLTNKLLEILPTHQRALGNKVYYEDELLKSEGVKKKGEDEAHSVDSASEEKSYGYHKTLYEQLCRGDVSPPIELVSQLKCIYVDHGNPFLLLAPFKVEEVYHHPNIYIFHDVLADAEIATIKKIATPRFRRATVQNSESGELEVAQYRISKSAWLKEHEHKHIADVVQRVNDMSHLSMDTAEELQVVNYGIGGHYEPHYDFARKDEVHHFDDLGAGNRIATLLFYMSDVAQGGATVFPNIQAAVWPKKGTAAFWYNLHESGEGDVNTRHAACPVLAGSKWISNKWIHERGQEFLRPCTSYRPPPELTA